MPTHKEDMNLTSREVRLFRRVHEKHKVSLDFLTINFHKVVKFLKYVTSLHCIIKRKLIMIGSRAVIKYSYLRKSFFCKDKRRSIRRIMPWSKRILQYRKKMRAIEKEKLRIMESEDLVDEVDSNDEILPPDEVQRKIKEQLELLKSGKRTVLPDITTVENKSTETKHENDKLLIASTLSTRLNISSCVTDSSGEKDLKKKKLSCSKSCSIDINNYEISEEDLLAASTSTGIRHEIPIEKCSSKKSTASKEVNNSPARKTRLMFLDTLITKLKVNNENDNREGDNVSDGAVIDHSEKEKNDEKIKSPIEKDLECNNTTKRKLRQLDFHKSPLEIQKEKRMKADPSDSNQTQTDKLLNHQFGDESSQSSSDVFLGFTDNELTIPLIPGMLPTPIVHTEAVSSTKSAFVSKALDDFLSENHLADKLPKNDDHSVNDGLKTGSENNPLCKFFEEGLVHSGSKPPKMYMPAIPKNFVRPRTLAEKRNLLQQKQENIKYFMIENENTIYRELMKRSKNDKLNVNLIKCIQNMPFPFTRDCWKASSWLATSNGRFYFRILKMNGFEFKLLGVKGDHEEKYINFENAKEEFLKSFSFDYPRIGCPAYCKQSELLGKYKICLRKNECMRENEKNCSDMNNKNNSINITKYSTLLLDKETNSREILVKAAPLSRKCVMQSKNSFEPNLGPFEIYKMPKIELEVFPKLNEPLDEKIKPYLKMILPSGGITKEWAEFAVSTLVTKVNYSIPNSSSLSCSASDKLKTTDRKSFTFVVPYLNDQNYVLTRKIYNRQENMDFMGEEMEFLKLVQKNDNVSFECGKVLSEMIDSVAIGLSGDSLIKDDPDLNYVNNAENSLSIKSIDDIDAFTNKTKENVKIVKRNSQQKIKLMKELRRLNAKIVDAEILFSEDCNTKCLQPYCALGCVCQSINSDSILTTHCRKPKCMLKCTCKHITSVPSEKVKNPTMLSEEEVLLIRKRTTAKLAKEEKEFCATIVLTDKETLVINDPKADKKRVKKLPKRYDDYDTVTELNENSSISGGSEISASAPHISCGYDEEPVPPPRKKFKHCTVDLMKISELDDLEPWCMIHELYRCFCQGEETSGKPFKIDKNDSSFSQEEEIVYARRPIYSFERTESVTKQSQNFTKVTSTTTSSNKSTAHNEKGYISVSREEYIKKIYLQPRNNVCQRSRAIPTKTYYNINVKRATEVRKKIKSEENDKTQFLLLDRMYKTLHSESEQSAKKSYNSDVEILVPSKNLVKDSCLPNGENVNTGSRMKIVNQLTEDEISSAKKVLSDKENVLLKNNENIDEKETLLTDVLQGEESLSFSTSSEDTPSKLPVISSVCSLNSLYQNGCDFPSTFYQSTENETNTSNESTLPNFADQFEISSESDSSEKMNETNMANNTSPSLNKKLYASSISKLNTAVTTTMQSICAIQKKHTKFIPPPVNSTLSSHKWKLFLQAYKENLVFVWEVKLSDGKFFAATVVNIMPLVPNALSVINIRTINEDKLPLLAKMVKIGFTNNKTDSLSVLMAGYHNFWKILGFLHNSSDFSCHKGVYKPTPKSHPQLSAKINALYRYIVLRELQNMKKSQSSKLENQEGGASSNNAKSGEMNSINTNIVESPTIIPDDKFVGENTSFIHSTKESNLLIKKGVMDRNNDIVVPLSISTDHQWLIIDLVDDFSHIYIPKWKKFLSHSCIKKALRVASQTKRIVRVGQEISTLNMFATNCSRRRIYLGPYPLGSKIDLVLYQNCDGYMLLREDFEKRVHIQRKEATVGFWLYKKNNEFTFDLDTPKILKVAGILYGENTAKEIMPMINVKNHNDVLSKYVEKSLSSGESSKHSKKADDIEDDDEDCIILDDEPEQEQYSHKTNLEKSQPFNHLTRNFPKVGNHLIISTLNSLSEAKMQEKSTQNFRTNRPDNLNYLPVVANAGERKSEEELNRNIFSKEVTMKSKEKEKQNPFLEIYSTNMRNDHKIDYKEKQFNTKITESRMEETNFTENSSSSKVTKTERILNKSTEVSLNSPQSNFRRLESTSFVSSQLKPFEISNQPQTSIHSERESKQDNLQTEVETKQVVVQVGYFVSNIKEIGRYPIRKVGNQFFIKSLDKSIVRVAGFKAAIEHLNKQKENFTNQPVQWKYVLTGSHIRRFPVGKGNIGSNDSKKQPVPNFVHSKTVEFNGDKKESSIVKPSTSKIHSNSLIVPSMEISLAPLQNESETSHLQERIRLQKRKFVELSPSLSPLTISSAGICSATGIENAGGVSLTKSNSSTRNVLPCKYLKVDSTSQDIRNRKYPSSNSSTSSTVIRKRQSRDSLKSDSEKLNEITTQKMCFVKETDVDTIDRKEELLDQDVILIED